MVDVATTRAEDEAQAAAKKRVPVATQRAEAARRRVAYLNARQDRATVRAKHAGVLLEDLPAYIEGLKDLGLLDAGERLTPAGNVLLYIASRPPRDAIEDRPKTEHQAAREGSPAYFGPIKRDVWKHLGGDEARLNHVLDFLKAQGLILEKKGHFVVA